MLDGGARVRVRPGTTVARVNAALARHGRVLGPDPASAAACTVGGVVANNASGMTAGTTRNAYRTMASVTVVLPSGTVVDTGDPAADDELARAEPKLCEALLTLKAEIEADPELTARVRASTASRTPTATGSTPSSTAGRPCGDPARADRRLPGHAGLRRRGGVRHAAAGPGPCRRGCCSSRPSRPPRRRALLAGTGARAVELMDGNTLRASVRVAGVPADWAELPRSARRCSSSCGHRTGRPWRRRSGRPRKCWTPCTSSRPSRRSATPSPATRPPSAACGPPARRSSPPSEAPGRPARLPRHGGLRRTTGPPRRSLRGPARPQAAHGFDAAVAGHAAHGSCTSSSPSTRRTRRTWSGTRRSWRRSAG